MQITVVSTKGAVDKTTVAANLGEAADLGPAIRKACRDAGQARILGPGVIIGDSRGAKDFVFCCVSVKVRQCRSPI